MHSCPRLRKQKRRNSVNVLSLLLPFHTDYPIVQTIASLTLPLSPLSQLETQQYKRALALIDTPLTELKGLDDKMILTKVHLLKSRVYRGIGNMAKAKVRCFQSHPPFSYPFIDLSLLLQQAALTSSRSPAIAHPSSGPPIRNPTRRKQRLHDSVFVPLRDI